MTFTEALEQMEKGRVVARRKWPEFNENIGLAIYTGGTFKCIRWVRGGQWHWYHPVANSEIFATDWENIEAARPASE
jgi:hypothetical protein